MTLTFQAHPVKAIVCFKVLKTLYQWVYPVCLCPCQGVKSCVVRVSLHYKLIAWTGLDRAHILEIQSFVPSARTSYLISPYHFQHAHAVVLGWALETSNWFGRWEVRVSFGEQRQLPWNRASSLCSILLLRGSVKSNCSFGAWARTGAGGRGVGYLPLRA